MDLTELKAQRDRCKRRRQELRGKVELLDDLIEQEETRLRGAAKCAEYAAAKVAHDAARRAALPLADQSTASERAMTPPKPPVMLSVSEDDFEARSSREKARSAALRAERADVAALPLPLWNG